MNDETRIAQKFAPPSGSRAIGKCSSAKDIDRFKQKSRISLDDQATPPEMKRGRPTDSRFKQHRHRKEIDSRFAANRRMNRHESTLQNKALLDATVEDNVAIAAGNEVKTDRPTSDDEATVLFDDNGRCFRSL